MTNDRPLKVAFLASCVRGGGAGWSMYYLLKYLDRRLIEPVVVIPDRGVFGDRYDELGVQVVLPGKFPETRTQKRLSGGNGFCSFISIARNGFEAAGLIPRLARLLHEMDIDLLYCNNMRMHEIGAPAAQLARVPCVLHARNMYDAPMQNRLYREIARLPAVRRVIANSVATAEPYKGKVAQKVSVVHNGIDCSEYDRETIPRGTLRADLGLDSDDVIIGYTGRIEPRKGIDVLIRAAAKVLDQRKKVVFVVVGSVPVGGSLEYRIECEDLARQLGISDRVIFTGFRKDVRPAVTDFDVLCLPSYKEPFGRSIIEGMGLQIPVVACRSGGVLEIITDGVDGVLVPPYCSDSLAAALGRLVDDPDLRKRLGGAGHACVQKRFNVEKLSRQIQSILLQAA
jgi:L-malate glycosyltransferase